MKWAPLREQIRTNIQTKKRTKRDITAGELDAMDRRLRELQKRKKGEERHADKIR